MFQDLRDQLEREVEEAERFGGCFGEGGGSGGSWRCSSCSCACIGRGRLCRRRHFFNVLLGSGGWRGVMVFFFLERMGLGGRICRFLWIWVVYIYMSNSARVLGMVGLLRIPLNGSYFGVNYSVFLWIRRK